MINKVVLLTGGSRGIGRATAILLAELGARVVIAARDNAALEAVAVEIQARQGQCLALTMDLTDPESIKQSIQQVIHHFGRIDVLINNAGVLHYGAIANTSLEAWRRVMATNLTGPFLCIREVLPIMQAQGHGHILNVVSHAGLYGFPHLGAYSASKFGLTGLSQSLGRELHNTGIKVSYVCPGAINTDMLNAFPEEVAGPMQRGKPEQVAQCIYNLLADNNGRRHRSRMWDKLVRHLHRRFGTSQIEVWNSWQ
jgi:3-oxoacyl-[acyl-carrier protein] reductase